MTRFCSWIAIAFSIAAFLASLTHILFFELARSQRDVPLDADFSTTSGWPRPTLPGAYLLGASFSIARYIDWLTLLLCALCVLLAFRLNSSKCQLTPLLLATCSLYACNFGNIVFILTPMTFVFTVATILTFHQLYETRRQRPRFQQLQNYFLNRCNVGKVFIASIYVFGLCLSAVSFEFFNRPGDWRERPMIKVSALAEDSNSLISYRNTGFSSAFIQGLRISTETERFDISQCCQDKQKKRKKIFQILGLSGLGKPVLDTIGIAFTEYQPKLAVGESYDFIFYKKGSEPTVEVRHRLRAAFRHFLSKGTLTLPYCSTSDDGCHTAHVGHKPRGRDAGQ